MPRKRRPYGARHRRMEKVLAVAYAGGWPARLWSLFPVSGHVRLERHELAVGRDRGRPPLKVAFGSDFHLGPTTARRTLDRAFQHLREAEPDVLLLGGDYVFLGATQERVNELNDRVNGVPAELKIAVLGNHDFWARPARLEVALSAAGTVILVNEALRLPPPHDDVGIAGLDDPFTALDEGDFESRQRAVDHALDSIADAQVRIAVCHSPDGLAWIRGRGIHLLLAGHTHGGHVALPGYRPLFVPSPVGKRYPYGLHQVEGTTLFVSRGVGGSLVPFRTWAPPDVAVFVVR
ncbi:MAG TPA: metallophosphoesterase [Vicinamibacteria bacterium]|nr:metallophosphoesterase [Vicinamibacteria bacterium]